MYNWQHEKWPKFQFDEGKLLELGLDLAQSFGKMAGLIQAISKEEQENALLQLMVAEAITSSQIEGEYFSREDVMSSIKNHLGIKLPNIYIKDAKVRGIGELMVVARRDFDTRLSVEQIKQWHTILFHNNKYINAGEWRIGKDSMQIVSGGMGKEVVHFEAPPSTRVPQEMEQFVEWYNNFHSNKNLLQVLIKAAITHLYFESIHPFEDGNGRIGRALAEKCLSQELGYPVTFSLSSAIEKNKKAYYDAFKSAQQTLNITEWIVYFGKLILEAESYAEDLVKFLLKKSKFYTQFNTQINDRQTKALNKMWDAGPDGFKGGMTAKKYISITQTSKATATRDLQQLAETGALRIVGSGRSVHYVLPIENL